MPKKKKPKELNMTLNLTERYLVGLIVDRYMKEIRGAVRADRLTVTMDLTACHLNGNPLNLERMAAADFFFDLAHDVAGINRNLNRTTGQLENCFSPRFSDTTRLPRRRVKV